MNKKATTSANSRLRLTPSMNSVRSAVSNGSAIFRGVDHRSAAMRRVRDLMADLAANDFGGEGNIGESERILIRKAAMLCLQTEMMEAQWAAGDDPDGISAATPFQLQTYQTAVNSLRRCLETLSGGYVRPRRDGSLATDVTSAAQHVLRSFRNGADQP